MRRVAVILLLGICALAKAQPASAPAPVQAVRGLAATVEIGYAPVLRGRTEQAPNSPLMVRVLAVPGAARQRVEFVGSVAGVFDLRDYLERADGGSLDDLPPIPVEVLTQLPPGHGTDLFSSESSGFTWSAVYRELLWAAVALWVLAPAVYLVVRAMRKPQAAPVELPAAPPPAPEEQLRAVLAAAAARDLSIAERGQLELLVLRFLGTQLGLPVRGSGDLAETLAALRGHPETRGFVVALERWLHARDGDAARAHAAQALEELRHTRLPAAPSAALAAEVRS